MRNRASLRKALVAVFLLATPALAQDAARPVAALETALATARGHLAAGEPQIAESVYRGVLLEAWHLLGLRLVAEGDLVEARDALERSTVSAAVGVLAPRIDLALVQHQLGEIAGAQQRLRALTRQFRSEREVWQTLIGTLIADGRRDEVEEQLEDLRLVLPEVATELEESLAGLEDSEQAREALRPRIDLSRLGDGAGERDQLRAVATEAVARAQRGLASLDRARAGAPTEHLDALLDAISSAPLRGDAPEPLEPAVRAIEQGQLREAEGLLRRAQKQGHDSPKVLQLLGLVRSAGGNGVRARLELARIVGREGSPKAVLDLLAGARQRAPSSEEVLAAQARAALSVGLTDVAIQALEPLAGIFPEVAEYPYMLGTARTRLGLMTEAVEALQRSVELAPDEASYRFALAEALNHEKRFDEAELHLIPVLETSPEDLAATAALAQAEEGLDKLESAERHARSVLAQGPPGGGQAVLPEHAAAHLVIGMVRMKQQRYAEAREALEAAIAGGPDAAKAHYQLSLACMRLGDRESAKHHLDLYHAALEGAGGKTIELTLESDASPARSRQGRANGRSENPR